MDVELLKALTPEQFGAWRQSPVGKVFFQFVEDFVTAGKREFTEAMLASPKVDVEYVQAERGKILAWQEIAMMKLDVIQRFYSTEEDDGRQQASGDRADAV